MKFHYILVFAAFIATAQCAPQQIAESPLRSTRNPYSYEWEVKSEADKLYYGANERTEGDNKTIGKYYVLLPDERVLIVEYSVDDDSGFLPRISMQPSPFKSRK